MRLILLFLILMISKSAISQTRINNGSFEDEPSDATTPHGWYECNELTTPDIFPGVWGVYDQPSDGDTYMGLITRPNNSWESIGQRLRQPLESDKCYSFMIDMAFSNTYAGYNNPIRLRIWLGNERCDQGQLIYESDLIDHTSWKTYLVKFTTDKPFSHIILEAYHNQSPVRYKGNILLDHITTIKRCGRA